MMIHKKFQTKIRLLKKVKSRIDGNVIPTKTTTTILFEGLALLEQLDRNKSAQLLTNTGITISNAFVCHIPKLIEAEADLEVWYNQMQSKTFDQDQPITKLQCISVRFGFGSTLQHTELFLYA